MRRVRTISLKEGYVVLRSEEEEQTLYVDREAVFGFRMETRSAEQRPGFRR